MVPNDFIYLLKEKAKSSFRNYDIFIRSSKMTWQTCEKKACFRPTFFHKQTFFTRSLLYSFAWINQRWAKSNFVGKYGNYWINIFCPFSQPFLSVTNGNSLNHNKSNHLFKTTWRICTTITATVINKSRRESTCAFRRSIAPAINLVNQKE